MQTSYKIGKEEFYESPNNWQDNSVKLVCSKCGKDGLFIENDRIVCKECGDGLYEMLNNCEPEFIGIPIEIHQIPATIGTRIDER